MTIEGNPPISCKDEWSGAESIWRWQLEENAPGKRYSAGRTALRIEARMGLDLIARVRAAETVIVNHIAEINELQDFLDWQALSGKLVDVHE